MMQKPLPLNGIGILLIHATLPVFSLKSSLEFVETTLPLR
jgi:hypothetical protein